MAYVIHKGKVAHVRLGKPHRAGDPVTLSSNDAEAIETFRSFLDGLAAASTTTAKGEEGGRGDTGSDD